jgi:hypothetical protein
MMAPAAHFVNSAPKYLVKWHILTNGLLYIRLQRLILGQLALHVRSKPYSR